MTRIMAQAPTDPHNDTHRKSRQMRPERPLLQVTVIENQRLHDQQQRHMEQVGGPAGRAHQGRIVLVDLLAAVADGLPEGVVRTVGEDEEIGFRGVHNVLLQDLFQICFCSVGNGEGVCVSGQVGREGGKCFACV